MAISCTVCAVFFCCFLDFLLSAKISRVYQACTRGDIFFPSSVGEIGIREQDRWMRSSFQAGHGHLGSSFGQRDTVASRRSLFHSVVGSTVQGGNY